MDSAGDAPSDPGDEGRHTLHGCFLPGLARVAQRLAGADAATGHAVMGKEGGPQIHVDEDFVQLGAAGGSPVVLANASFVAWVNAISSFASQPAPTGYQATKVKAT